jgi:prepilin-type N-terminal cleavage/methylation domain-containing protein
MSHSTRGFSLLEVLAAIALTGLLISIFGQVFAIARGADQTPSELLSAVFNARMALYDARLAAPAETAAGRSHFKRDVAFSKLRLTERPETIAPPLESPGASQSPAPAARYMLQEVDVVITAPSGRRTELNGVTALTIAP